MPIMSPEEISRTPGHELEPLVRDGLRELVARRVSGKVDIQEIWTRSLISETNYWDLVLSRAHERDSSEFFERLERYSDQPFDFAEYCAEDEDGVCKVLDVGAGPLTVLGTVHEALKVEIEAIDPLADHYNDALTRHGLTAPVRTASAKGEELSQHFAPNTFHLVHSLNALDHAYDPLACIHEMVNVCKPGGSVILIGGENVALLNVYGGLHQWNFLPVDGDLVIWRPDRKFSVQKALGNKARVNAWNPAPERYFVEIRVVAADVSLPQAAAVSEPAVDYATIYDDVYKSNVNYTLSHVSPGLRTALMNAPDILSAGPRHLDVGAGPGYLVETLSRPPFRKRSEGLEISAIAVKMAEERLGAGVVRTIENPDAWPVEDNSFDLITCFDVLEHLELCDIVRMISEIRRVGRPGGVALFNISLRDSSSRDIHGRSLHRTVQSADWWCERIPFKTYTVNVTEQELYGRWVF